MMSLADHLFKYYRDLRPPLALPAGIDWLYPQKDPQTLRILRLFLDKYYDDKGPRRLLLGINPGRFGAGVTGINFTAPRQLRHDLGIEALEENSSELSAEFIYEMIHAFGGPAAFYGQFFIGAVCPLGFVKDGRNLNYYDDRSLLTTVTPFITDSMNSLLRSGMKKDVAICIGEGKNLDFLKKLNDSNGWFGEIRSVPHPRFILQYKRREKAAYIEKYLRVLSETVG